MSLDIEFLYTNISHRLASETFSRRISTHPKFVLLLDLLKFVLTNNVFQGTLLAPALATIVIADSGPRGGLPGSVFPSSFHLAQIQ